MDRGLGNYYRGNSGNARRDDRRYDDFYDRDRRGGSGNFRGGGGRNSRSGGFRPGDKRRQDQQPSGANKKSKNDTRRDNRRSSSTTKSGSQTKKDSKKDEPKEDEIDIPDDQVEIPDHLMDNVEKLRQRADMERNVADEDIDKLVVFCYNGKGYDCLTCGFMLMKDHAFKNHLMSKSHVMNVIDARSDKKYQPTRDLLDIDIASDGWFEKSDIARKVIYKQAKVMMKAEMDLKKRELESFNRDPSNFFSVNMASKKCATMTGDTVRITSIVESTIDVKEFSTDRFFGCEFVKSVASFQCRLCDIKIHNASEVLPHIDSRVHRNKYQMHLRRQPDYEKKQKDQNKDLGLILQEHEGQAVLLSETNTKSETEDDEDNQGKTLLEEIDTILVRVPEILNPPVKEDPKGNEPEKETETKKVDEPEKKEEETTTDKPVENEKKNDTTTEPVASTSAETEVKEETPDEPMETEQVKEETTTESTPPEVKEETPEETEAETSASQDEPPIAEDPTETAAESTDKPAAEEATEKVEAEKTEDEKPEIKTPAPTSAKKTTKKAAASTRGRGTARRGTPKRLRGGKAAGSPKTRGKPAVEQVETPTAESPAKETPTVEEKPSDEKTDAIAADGSFMDGFQVVDEVQEE
ncbi:enolase-phosphatase E1-like isoform X4 [Clytia hemisphaerica]|uniref:enolase-phosphatase E1-like isoform X4 n=1 Tax=Clytia hemisphaerica TaxID=252671 RepID=UPI0034D56E15